MNRRALVVGLLLSAARLAAAQELRGTVSDSASRQPIPGAVLLFIDATGQTIGRNITNERGEYRAVLSPEIRRMRVLRLGFRPRDVSVPVVVAPVDSRGEAPASARVWHERRRSAGGPW